MPKGGVKDVGSEFTNKNGYTYIKTADRGWIPKSLLIAEEKLGRRLKADERAYYIDGNRENLNPDNIDVKSTSSKRSPQARLARVEFEIQETKARLVLLEEERAKLQAEAAASVES